MLYLQDIPLDDAWRRLTAALTEAGLWQPLEAETVSLDQALGRVTAEPVWARISSPHYHAAAMDGYAVRARDTAAAGGDCDDCEEAGAAARPATTAATSSAEVTWRARMLGA